MKRAILLSPLLLGLALYAQGISPAEILIRVDERRSIGPSFGFRLKIESYGAKGLERSAIMSGYASGEDKSLARYDEPANMRGKKILMVKDDMHIFIPKTQRPVKLTSSQRLMGQASNGDVMNIRFQADYDCSVSGAQILDPDGSPLPCIILALRAKRRGATYGSMTLWVEESTFFPVKAECYALSGKKMKTVEYSERREFEGKTIVARTVIRDLVATDEKTVIEFLEMKAQSVPDSYFTPEYLLRMQ